MSLSPTFCSKILLSEVSLAGILITILSFVEGEGLICGKFQYLIFSLCLALKPRMLMTLDENLELKQIQVMVGQAIDTVGMTGNPKTISGFQVNTTPLLFSEEEKCELNGDDFISASSILEDIVLVKENPKASNR
jgi:26S proteasome regulatory subunit N1